MQATWHSASSIPALSAVVDASHDASITAFEKLVSEQVGVVCVIACEENDDAVWNRTASDACAWE